MLATVWDTLVRWRTYAVNILLALLVLAPEVLNSPEVLAVIPADYHRWFLFGAFLVNIWLRPRPASRAGDAEVQVKKAIKDTDYPATVTVEAGGEIKAQIDA